MCKIAHFTLQTTMAKHKVSIRLEFNMNAGDVAASEGILFDFIGIECKVYCFFIYICVDNRESFALSGSLSQLECFSSIKNKCSWYF